MATTFRQNDTAPPLTATLTGADGSPQVLTGATVRFSMRPAHSLTPVISRASCAIVDAAAGTVRYAWQAGDTAVAGRFLAEFEVTFADSTVLTFPNDSTLALTITSQIA